MEYQASIYDQSFKVERKEIRVQKKENDKGQLVTISELTGSKYYQIQFPAGGIQDLIDKLIGARDTE